MASGHFAPTAPMQKKRHSSSERAHKPSIEPKTCKNNRALLRKFPAPPALAARLARWKMASASAPPKLCEEFKPAKRIQGRSEGWQYRLPFQAKVFCGFRLNLRAAESARGRAPAKIFANEKKGESDAFQGRKIPSAAPKARGRALAKKRLPRIPAPPEILPTPYLHVKIGRPHFKIPLSFEICKAPQILKA